MLRILHPEKGPVILIFPLYKIVLNTVLSKLFFIFDFKCHTLFIFGKKMPYRIRSDPGFLGHPDPDPKKMDRIRNTDKNNKKYTILFNMQNYLFDTLLINKIKVYQYWKMKTNVSLRRKICHWSILITNPTKDYKFGWRFCNLTFLPKCWVDEYVFKVDKKCFCVWKFNFQTKKNFFYQIVLN